MGHTRPQLPEFVQELDPPVGGKVRSEDTSDKQPSTLASGDHEALRW